MEKPRTKRFLEELRSTNCRLDRPTAVIMPKRVQNKAPKTGSGRDANRALNLPTSPKNSIMAAPYWITRLLPTWKTVTRNRSSVKNKKISYAKQMSKIVKYKQMLIQKSSLLEEQHAVHIKNKKKGQTMNTKTVPLWFQALLYLD